MFSASDWAVPVARRFVPTRITGRERSTKMPPPGPLRIEISPSLVSKREGLGDRRAGDVELLLEIRLEPEAVARAHLAPDDAGLDGAPDRLGTGIEVGNGFTVGHDDAGQANRPVDL